MLGDFFNTLLSGFLQQQRVTMNSHYSSRLFATLIHTLMLQNGKEYVSMKSFMFELNATVLSFFCCKAATVSCYVKHVCFIILWDVFLNPSAINIIFKEKWFPKRNFFLRSFCINNLFCLLPSSKQPVGRFLHIYVQSGSFSDAHQQHRGNDSDLVRFGTT